MGCQFANPSLLVRAVTHKSFGSDHYERLEFLGDAVLELSVTEHLFRNYANPEGELTNWRAANTVGTNLAR